MKKKIIGILVCLMLMTTFLTAAQNTENISVKYESEENNSISFIEGDVPVWKVGDKWTYNIDVFSIDFSQSNMSINIDAKIEDLSLEVAEVTTDFYKLNFTSDISGSYEIKIDFGDGPINITGELEKTTIEGFIIYNKTDLGIKQINVEISGKLTVKIEQPYIKLSFLPKFPIRATITLEIILEDPIPLIDFPLNETKCWGLPATNFTVDGTIESPWLRLFDKLNRLINPIIPLIENITKKDLSELKDISDILKDILPIIDICDLLTNYVGIGCDFEIPEIPPIICLTNLSKELVTVPAGTFEAYNISIIGTNLANIYYNDTVGNIIKIAGNLQDIFPSVSNINVELVSYVHNPDP